MSYMDAAITWAATNRADLERRGFTLNVGRSSGERDKHSASVAFERDGWFADLVVWSSGEVESGFKQPGADAVFDHHKIRSDEGLIAILEAFKRAMVDEK